MLGKRKQDLKNRDLDGKVIEQRTKDSKSVEVDGDCRFVGHRFLLKTKLFGDKRCLYCGKWFHWKDTDCLTWLRQKNIDDTNIDKVLEPVHCGSGHCSDYHHAWLNEIERRKMIAKERQTWRLFKDLKHKGAVS